MDGAKLLDLVQRLRNHAHTRLIRSSFDRFGTRTVICAPVRLVQPRGISVGSRTYIGAGCWIQGGESSVDQETVALRVGNRVSITGYSTLSAAVEVIIEDDVLIGRGAHISDHSHQVGGDLPVRDQGITQPKPVRIGAGSWLGQNVVVMPGVTIGKRAVIGANSVVTKDVPDGWLAVGSPARLLKEVQPPDQASNS